MKRTSLLLLCTLLGLLACSSDDQNSLTVFNAMANAPVIDLLVDNDLKVESLAYGTSSEDVGVESGDFRVEVRTPSVLASIIDRLVSFTSDYKYRLYLTGSVDDPNMIVHRDLTDDGPGRDEDFRFRIVDLSQKSGSLDIYLLDASGTVGQSAPVFESVGYQEVTRFKDVRLGAIRVVATARGTRNIVFESGLLPIEESRDYSFVLYDGAQQGASLRGNLVLEN